MQLIQYCGFYTTVKGAEIPNHVPVKGEADEGWTTVLALPVKDVRSGDLLSVAGKIQRTNNLHKFIWKFLGGRIVGNGSRLALTYAGANKPVPLTNWTGFNVDKDMHHATSVDAQHWQSPADYGDVEILFQAKNASTNAVTSGPKRWLMEVDRGLGHLSVIHTRPVEWPPVQVSPLAA